MTPAERAAEGWEDDHVDGPPLVLELDDGGLLYPSRDVEGNGAGALFAKTPRGMQVLLLDPARK